MLANNTIISNQVLFKFPDDVLDDTKIEVGKLLMVEVEGDSESLNHTYFLKVRNNEDGLNYVNVNPPYKQLSGKYVLLRVLDKDENDTIRPNRMFKLKVDEASDENIPDYKAFMEYESTMKCIQHIFDQFKGRLPNTFYEKCDLTKLESGVPPRTIDLTPTEEPQPPTEEPPIEKPQPPIEEPQPPIEEPLVEEPPAEPPEKVVDVDEKYIANSCKPKDVMHNIKNSCYMDTVLFALFFNPTKYIIKNIIERNDMPQDCQDLHTELKNITKIINGKESTPTKLMGIIKTQCDVTKFRSTFEKCSKDLSKFSKGEEHDAEEFLNKLFSVYALDTEDESVNYLLHETTRQGRVEENNEWKIISVKTTPVTNISVKKEHIKNNEDPIINSLKLKVEAIPDRIGPIVPKINDKTIENDPLEWHTLSEEDKENLDFPPNTEQNKKDKYTRKYNGQQTEKYIYVPKSTNDLIIGMIVREIYNEETNTTSINNTPVVFDKKITIGDNVSTNNEFVLDRIISHRGESKEGHYVMWYRCIEDDTEKWYYYNDIGGTVNPVKSFEDVVNNENVKTQSRLVFYRKV